MLLPLLLHHYLVLLLLCLSLLAHFAERLGLLAILLLERLSPDNELLFHLLQELLQFFLLILLDSNHAFLFGKRIFQMNTLRSVLETLYLFDALAEVALHR